MRPPCAVAQSIRTFNGCALSLPYLFVYRMEVLLVKSADWVPYPFASLLRVGSLMRLRGGLLKRLRKLIAEISC